MGFLNEPTIKRAKKGKQIVKTLHVEEISGNLSS